MGTLFLVMAYLSYVIFKSQRTSDVFIKSLLSSLMIYINAFALSALLSGMDNTVIVLEVMGIASALYISLMTATGRVFLRRLIALLALLGVSSWVFGLEVVLAVLMFFSMIEILKESFVISLVLTGLLIGHLKGLELATVGLLIGVGWVSSEVVKTFRTESAFLMKRDEWLTVFLSGVFAVISYLLARFVGETAAFMFIFAFLYLSNLYIVRSMEEMRKRSERSAHDISRKFADVVAAILKMDPKSSLDEYLQQILETSADLIEGVDGGVVEVFEGGVYKFKAVMGYDREKLKDINFTEEEMIKVDRPTVIRRIVEKDRTEGKMKGEKYQKLSEALPDIKATLICPLFVKGKFYGGIFLDNFTDEDAFGESDKETIEIFGKLASLFLELKIEAQENEGMSKKMGLIVKLGGEGLLASDKTTVYRKAYEMVKELYGDVLNLFVWTEIREGMWAGTAIDRYGNTIELDVPEDEGVMSEVLKEGRTKVVHDVSKNPKFYEIIPGTGSMIGVPIHYRGSFYGGLDIEITEKYYFKEQDVKFFEELASALGLIFKHYENMEKLEILYYSVIKSLANAVDMKDPYTYGHSDRVAYYSIGIAKAMGCDDETMKRLKFGATLHDIGKIGIPIQILNKRGELTDEEYYIIKSHTILGYNIVKDIPDFTDIAGIIKWHHERWDGKGYPDGLKGKQIPIEARIVAVADTFDAMTTNRPYRKAMPVDLVIEKLKEFSGTQFDPDVVEVAVGILEKLWIDYRKEHGDVIFDYSPERMAIAEFLRNRI